MPPIKKGGRHRVKIDALTRLGELLKVMPKATGAPGNQHTGKVDRFSDGTGPTPTLRDYGIDKKVSAVAQQLGQAGR